MLLVVFEKGNKHTIKKTIHIKDETFTREYTYCKNTDVDKLISEIDFIISTTGLHILARFVENDDFQVIFGTVQRHVSRCIQ
jgi:hypothetical protein